MVLALAVVVGVLVGAAFGGRLGRLADLELRGRKLFAAAIALQLAAYPSGVLPWTISDRIATGLWLATYGVLIVCAVLNRSVPGFPLATLGLASNLAAVLANDGHMPALPAALRAAGVRLDGVHNNSVANADPNLAWLVDRWGAPEWLPLANVYSLGDVLLGLGAIVIVATAMGARLPGRTRRAATV